MLGRPGGDFYRPHWSPSILEELRRNLVAKSGMPPDKALRLLARLRRSFPDAEVTPSNETIEAMTNHPGDRHVLATAVAADCEWLVTYNIRDFLPVACEPVGVEVLLPDTFLYDLLKEEPLLVLEALTHQVGRYTKPTMGIMDLCDRLKAPRFTEGVTALLNDFVVVEHLERLGATAQRDRWQR